MSPANGVILEQVCGKPVTTVRRMTSHRATLGCKFGFLVLDVTAHVRVGSAEDCSGRQHGPVRASLQESNGLTAGKEVLPSS